jgi:hypothetical protein
VVIVLPTPFASWNWHRISCVPPLLASHLHSTLCFPIKSGHIFPSKYRLALYYLFTPRKLPKSMYFILNWDYFTIYFLSLSLLTCPIYCYHIKRLHLWGSKPQMST